MFERKKMNPVIHNTKMKLIAEEKLEDADRMFMEALGRLEKENPTVVSMDEREALEVFRQFTSGK